MDVLDKIKDQVEKNKVIIYMKGTPAIPQCGFSSRAVEALKQCGKEFSYVNILMDSEIFQNLPKFADFGIKVLILSNFELKLIFLAKKNSKFWSILV